MVFYDSETDRQGEDKPKKKATRVSRVRKHEHEDVIVIDKTRATQAQTDFVF